MIEALVKFGFAQQGLATSMGGTVGPPGTRCVLCAFRLRVTRSCLMPSAFPVVGGVKIPGSGNELPGATS